MLLYNGKFFVPRIQSRWEVDKNVFVDCQNNCRVFFKTIVVDKEINMEI